MIWYVVKGGKKQAKRAAGRRGIPARNCTVGKRTGDTFCEAPCTKKAFTKISNWFNERAPRSGKLPPGDLLTYKTEDCEASGLSGLGRRRRKRRR